MLRRCVGPAARGARRAFSDAVPPTPPAPAAVPEAAAETSGTLVEAAKERVLTTFEWYAHCAAEYPVRSNAVVSGILCAAGDVLAQLTEFRMRITSPDKESFNWKRTARMAFWGTAVCGPLLAVWYRTLHGAAAALRVSYEPVVSGRFAWLLERAPARVGGWLTALRPEAEVAAAESSRMLAGKVLVDSVCFQAPFLNLYFAVMGGLEGLSFREIYAKTKASFHRAWALSFIVWTPVQAVNLGFVPMVYQPMVVAAVQVGWQTTLSVLNHYHDYGSPRESAAAAPPAARTEAVVEAAERLAAAGAEPSAEEVHRRLRARLQSLETENRRLKRAASEQGHGAGGAGP